MKILLSYSKLHFDPTKKPSEHKFWGSSAFILAKSLYEILVSLGEVTYIDTAEYQKIQGYSFDLFVGIANNFYKILKSCHIKKSIYFAVNMHPRERNKVLLKFLIKERLSPFSIAGWDLLNFREIENGICNADYILCMGNMATYNSYIKYGVPKAKIKILNYGLIDLPFHGSTVKPDSKKRRYIYVSSEIGLRKGFDIIYSLFTANEILNKNFHLDIVGLPTNNYYKIKLDKFLKSLGDKVEYHGWINTYTKEYWRILKKNDFFIFPSLEEGQSGTVIEAIFNGVIPIISQNSGIDFSPIGNMELKTTSTYNLDLLKESINLPQEKLIDLKRKTLGYYREFHLDFKKKLEEAIRGCLKDELYPKFSITLSLFNKEKTIKKLIRLLHKACYEYLNIELHFIFDGCRDKTEAIVREFYKNVTEYKVSFAKTPNIFEIKTNNIGLKKSTGKYCVLVQDDNYILDKDIFFEAVNFLDKNPKAVILGGLAGVNYYPKGTSNLEGPGQITINQDEVYWRQDEHSDRNLKNRIFEVDAVMRGPIFIRKSFLEQHGYLDEIYAPLHHDDMDICFRAKSLGFKVYCILFDVLNTSLTVSRYTQKDWLYWTKIYKRNCATLYLRWKPLKTKNYLWLNRTPIQKKLNDRLKIVLQKIYIQLFKKN